MDIPINLPKKVQTRFKLRAVRAFPREFVAFVVGRRNQQGGLDVVDMYFPADQAKQATDSYIEIPQRWWTEAMEFAASRKLIVIGNVHTHVYRRDEPLFEPVQSMGDLANWDNVVDFIAGIANVIEGADGKKRCSDISFYGPPNPVEVTLK
jgi:hypothetical protein